MMYKTLTKRKKFKDKGESISLLSSIYPWKHTGLKFLFVLFLLLRLSPMVYSQNETIKITGTVIEEAVNKPLPGTTVSIKGTTNGTITDIEGNYEIIVNSKDDVLVFSMIGMSTQEVVVGNQTIINISLVQDVVGLDEVVVVGYGTVKKSDLTGSVAVISTKELTRTPSTSAAQALQGKAPGVLVTQSGKPGGSATIRVRGVGSINSGSDPIYIVDGVESSDISSIQAQDIESFQVLKDASAAAIYGANGSNGVIIITTKRGQTGKAQISFNGYTQFHRAPQQYDIMNAEQYSEFYSEINGDLDEYNQEFREKYYGEGWETGTNWQDELFNNGFSQNYHLSVSGGGENSNYSTSIGYVKEKGTVIKTNAENYIMRANSDFKFGKHFKFGESADLSYKTVESPLTNQITVYDLNPSPLMKVYNSYYEGGFETYQALYWEDDEGNLQQGDTPDDYDGTVYVNTVNNDKPNPLCAPSLSEYKTHTMRTRANIYMQVDFTDWLMFKVTPGVEVRNTRIRSWMPYFEGNRTPGNAILSETYSQYINYNIENQLLFNKRINDNHNVQATLVQNSRASKTNLIKGTEIGFDYEQLSTLANGGTSSTSLTGSTSDYRMLSYLGRVIYDYKSKYFATFSYRSDGVSVFAPEYRRGNFASTSLAWKVTEDFFKDVNNLDALKLRFGWGQTGNSDIGGGFQYLNSISDASNFSPVFGEDQEVVRAQYIFYGFASEEIHWESAEMWNFGVDVNMFKNKLQTNLEYYIKNNNDLLVAVPISAAYGRDDNNSNPWYNAGDIQNRGIEFSVQWRDNIGDFNYGIVSNISTVKNEVKYLPVTDITEDYNRTIVGHSIGALYGFVSEGIIQLDESNYELGDNGEWQTDSDGNYTGYKHAEHSGYEPQPGDIRYKDLNGDGKVTDLDKTIIGKTIPSFNYSIGFNCIYHNFDFNMFLYGVGDYDIYNEQRALMETMNSQDMDHNKFNSFADNHWTLENESTEYVRVDPSDENENERISTFWIEDGSFLRIKDVQLGYSFNENFCSRMGLSSVRAYVNASNLYCFTKYKGRDPEGFISSDPLDGGIDNGAYSMPRSFTAGIQVNF